MKKTWMLTIMTLALLMLLPSGISAQRRGAAYDGTVRREPLPQTDAGAAKAQRKLVSPGIVSFARTQKDEPRTLQTGTPRRSAPNLKAPRLALGDGTTIFGSLAYANNWTSYQWGIYSFKSGADLTPTHVADIYGDPNGGGTMVGDKYVYNYFIYTQEMGFTFTTLCQRNMKTGEETKVQQIYPDQSQITYGLAYDRTTDQVFALSYMLKYLDEDKMVQKYVPCLATLDLTTGRVSSIAELPKMAFLAITPGGEMYGASTGTDSKLYRINKTSGACTEVGATGVQVSNYTQSATFDMLTGKLYWACTHLDGTSALYDVNTATGTASKIADFANDEEYTGLYVPDPDVAEDAPAKVENVELKYYNGSLLGTVAAKAPSTTYGGKPLTGNVTVKMLVNRKEVASKEFAPGANVSFVPTITEEGIYNFEFVVLNAAGEGPRVSQAKYIGIDAPGAPADVKLSAAADGRAHITWTAPTIGMNDGYVDPSLLTYRIVRQPGDKLVADGVSGTEYYETVADAPDNYYYEVTAYCNGKQGLTAASNKGVFGSGSSLPYQWNFDTKEEFSLWTVIDANNDFDTKYLYGKWQYGADLKCEGDEAKAAVYKWSMDNAADDWLISPPFAVEKGKKYEVKYLVKTRGDEEQVQVAAGDLNAIDHLSPVGPLVKLKDKTYQEKSAQFTATKDGNYYVAFHCTSAKKRYYLFIDNVSVDEVPNDDAPAAVENLKVAADPQGALKATVSFTAPQKTKAGATLASVSKIDVFHGNETTPVYTFPAVAPGSEQSWTETVQQMGTYTYRVVASNAAGAGAKAEASAYVGPDKAKAVTNLTLTETGGKPVITWQAPTEGANGGYVNPATTYYRITRVCDHSSLNRVLAARHQGTTFTDNALDPVQSQYYVAYEVAPVTAAGEGETAESNYIVYGNPYSGGFSESFPGKTTQTGPWTVDPKQNHHWELKYNGEYPQCAAADKDNGLIVYVASEANPHTSSRLISPKISVKDLVVPVLKFCIYHYTQDNSEYDDVESNTLSVEAITPSGDAITLTPAYKVSNGYTGWMMYTVDLRQLKNQDWFQLAFVGNCNDAYGYDIALDMISITNENDIDLAAYAFAGPTKVNAGRSATYTLTVANNGFDTVNRYTVEFLRDGEVVNTQSGEPLKRGEMADYSYQASTKEADFGKKFAYSARVIVDGDRVESNNSSRTVTTEVAAPLYPELYSINAQKVDERKAFVFWNTPDALRITDDFESYPAWAINGIGNYTLVDGDGAETYAFSDLKFSHDSDPKAYIVFNPDALGASMLDEWKARSGSQVLAAFAANGVANNDWLISPEVYGGEHVAFYAKTAGDMWSVYGYETFEVLYSTTDKDISQFHSLSGTVETGKEWARYDYELPQNAKYFAIRCTSDDKFVFYLDDLSYVEKVDGSNFTVVGYKVYRNGELIKELPATQTNMFDENLADGTYLYSVSAVYANGESGRSKETAVQIGTTGIDGVSAASQDAVADVYTLDGKLVGKAVNPATLPAGTYVANGKKITVKK